MYTKIAGLSAAAALTATSALALTDATATTDLNLRDLPDPRGEILDVIPGEAMVSVQQCVEGGAWCKVDYDGTVGWAYSPYLTASLESEPTVVYQNFNRLDVETVDVNEDDRERAAAIGGLGAGALAMSAVGGPAAVAGAAAVGAIAGAESVPEETMTYVTANPVDPVYVDGEVVVGAGIPQQVELTAVPDSDYRYVYLNGNPVVVDADRNIVRVIR
ncbi:hypothetical protein OB2597_04023 [Pseudooceanicola batsensis HTCC2597]|uniref:SH3b domain-containing protein n=1 Tax=Pseudooceanicola batsensis (strain ATCC BAA-863 / DSM 15984 / KCTC 12145 / HTCC2597) TaxID=252305 RepID=A3U2K1_PSEBH|nr:DUF1236 domain-containing protein [Pseudooceanicola batsensis]EAQ01575.1 hypothetical protein OB2597_04023 [Pseudooceanicola batsensis HTCC2597]